MSSETVTHDPSVGVRPFGFAQGRRGHLPGGAGEGDDYRAPTGTTLIEFCGLPSMMRSV